MDPLWSATIRRHWPLFGAVFTLAVLVIADQVWFRPTARRYHVAQQRAEELGLAVDPNDLPPALPPRLFALLTDNSLSAAEAQERGNSGALTAELLALLSDLTNRHGMRAIVTEPGPVTQHQQSVTVRAHLKLRCRYDQFVALLADVAQGRELFSVDRFALTSDGSRDAFLELWVSQFILKQTKATS